MTVDPLLIESLNSSVRWVRKETLKIHKRAPETRLASALSPVELFVTLYYGGILNFNPNDLNCEKRDRFIVSKGHGAISLYPIFADLGFFSKKELDTVCEDGSIFGSIPDSLIPGFETINGSLGHGLGVACGVALALKNKKAEANVFVMVGDGELNEGSVWEAIMFAGHHRLDNLYLIVDNNKICMLERCSNILQLEPLDEKFEAFNWTTKTVDGHDIEQLYDAFMELKQNEKCFPKVLIANTIKGKGVSRLEKDPLCHVKTLDKREVDILIDGME